MVRRGTGGAGQCRDAREGHGMKHLDAIRNERTWQRRLKLAENETPGTPYDSIFEDALFALEMLETKEAGPAHTLARQILQSLGTDLARIFKAGTQLRDMAEALDVWRAHQKALDQS